MNEIALTLINEGTLYRTHQWAARQVPAYRFRVFSEHVSREARKMARDPDYAERVTMAYMLEAVAELDDYYQRHIAELDAQPAFRVLYEGDERMVGTHNECFAYVLRRQGQSVDYALKHGGWAIEPVRSLP